MLWSASAAHGNPVGEQVAVGTVAFDRAVPGALTVRQTTERAIINWREFSIGAGERTEFIQPGAGSAALNRVLGGNPSAIHGQLKANGQIFLLNPAGILVGSSGVIDTKGVLLSTLDIADAEFQSATKLRLSGDSVAAVQNLGRIAAKDGNVYLVARQVENRGSIHSDGTVRLVAGSEVLLGEEGKIAVLHGPGRVDNAGSITAAAAELRAAGGNVYALAINNSGVIRATTMSHEGGRIVLKADTGRASHSGTLAATGTVGGEVKVFGEEVVLEHNAIVDVSGVTGGGNALIGGGFQGEPGGISADLGADSTYANARRTFVGSNVMIDAGAGTHGDGGEVVIWSDDLTRYYGRISARGGATGGHGGNVEVSGKENLAFHGRVDVSAPAGSDGRVLLDPRDLTVIKSGLDDSVVTSTGVAAGSPDTITDVTVSSGAIEALTGNISLAASRDLFINADLNLANQDAADTVAFTAGGNLNVNGTVKSAGAPITFAASSGGVNSSAATLTVSEPVFGGDLTFANDGSGGILLKSLLPNTGYNITFSDKVRLGGNLTMQAADVTFAKFLDADATANNRHLTIQSSGTISFQGTVGSSGAFAALTTKGTGSTSFQTTAIKATAQSYEHDVTLAATATTLTGTEVIFGGAVDGTLSSAEALNVNATGATVFGGAVGNITPLKTITTDAAGTTTIKGGVVTATTQTFNDSVVVAADTTFTGTTVTFKKSVDADLEANSRALSVVSTGTTTFSGLIGYGPDGLVDSSDDLAFGLFKTDSGGKTAINGGGLNARVQTFNDATQFGANTTLTGTTVTFNDKLDGGGSNRALTFDTDGVVTLNGAVGTSMQLGSITTSASGTTVINSSNLKATTQTYNNPVTIGSAVALSGATLTFHDPVDGDGWETSALTIAGTTVTFNAGAPIGSNSTLKSFTTTGVGVTTLYNGSVKAATQSLAKLLLAANTTLSGSTISLNNTVDADATANNRTLTVNAKSVTTIGGVVGSTGVLAALTTDSAGSTVLKSSSISATTQSYADKVTIAGSSVLKADEVVPGTGQVTFSQTIDADSTSGTRSLTVNSTTTTFNGAIGVGVDGAVGGGDDRRLGTLKTDAGGTTTFKSSNVYATTQSYSDSIQLSSDVTFTGTTVTFGGTVNADAAANNRSLILHASGTATFSSIIGGTASLAALTTDASGTTKISTTEIHATTQSYNDLVSLAANVTLTGTAVSFAKNLNGDATANSRTLAVNATSTTFAGAIGNTGRLANLTTDSIGTTTLSGTSVAATTQTYGDHVVLGNNVTLTAAGGTVAFQKNLNGDVADTRTLTINATTTELTGAIGNSASLKSLTTDAIGTTKIQGGSVAVTTQTYNDPITFAGDVTLTGTTVKFSSTVDVTTASSDDLTIHASGVTTFTGNVGATTRLGALTTDSTGSTLIKASEINADTQSYGDAVTIGVNTVVQGGTGGIQASSVTFGSTVNGDQSNVRTLEVKSSGTTTFAGAVGGTVKLLSLTTDSGGSTALNASAIHATTQAYNDSIVLGTTSTLTGTTITFAQSINADDSTMNRGLAVNASGVTTFTGQIGISQALGALTTDSAGSTSFGGGAVTATTQIFNDPVTLAANTTFTGGDVTFGGTLNGSSASTFSLTADTTGTLTLKGAVGNTASLSSIVAKGVTIQTSSVITSGAQTYNGAVVLNANSTLSGGLITFNSTLDADAVANNRTLTISSTGVKTFAADVGATQALSSLTLSGGGGVSVNGSLIDAATQNYSSESLALGADVTFDGTTLTFASVDGNGNDLTLTGSGVTTLNSAITDVGAFVSNGGGTTVLNAGITTAARQLFSDAVTLGTAVTLTSSGTGANGNITFNSNVDGAFALTINTAETVTFAGAVGNATALASLDLNDGVTTATVVSGGSMTTSGAQVYGDTLSLSSDTTFAASSITFPAIAADSDANGHDVTLNLSGSASLGSDFFAGTIGDLSVTATGGITLADGTGIDAITTKGNQSYQSPVTVGSLGATLNGADITFASTINGNGAGLTLNGTGVTKLNAAVTGVTTFETGSGGVTMVGGDITGTGAQLYSDPIVLNANADLDSGAAAITLAGIVGNGNSLTVNSTSGLMTLGGPVSGVVNLTVGGGGTIAINGGSVSTTGTQAFNGATSLGANAIIKSTGTGTAGNITFGSTLNGSFTLAVTTGGATTFSGAVTGLTGLTTDSSGSTVINANITTTGDQTYNDPVTLGSGAKTIDAGTAAITLQAVTGSGAAGDDLTLSGSGTKNLQGNISSIDVFTSTTGPTVIGTSAGSAITITTASAQSYGAVTLNVNTTLNGTTIGALTSIDSAAVGAEKDLTLNFSTATTLYDGGKLGPTVKLNNLTISDDGELTGAITTVGTQRYAGNIVLNGDTVVASTGSGSAADITFDGTINAATAGTQGLVVNTGGTATFKGVIGTTALEYFTSDDAAGVSDSLDLQGNITTSGTVGIEINDSLVLGGAATAITLTAGANPITLAAVNGGGKNLTLDASGVTTLEESISNVAELLTVGAGGVTLGNTTAAVTISTTGNQGYADLITLVNHATLTSTTGQPSFSGTGVQGNTAENADLTLNFPLGTVNLAGGFGRSGPGADRVRNFQVDAGAGITINGAIETTGTQTYNDAITLATGAVALAGTDVTINDPVGGPFSLNITATGTATLASTATFNSNVTGVTIDGGGTTIMNNGGITLTNGDQDYDSTTLNLGADTSLISSDALNSIHLAAVTGNGFDLTIDADTAQNLKGNITGVDALAVNGGSDAAVGITIGTGAAISITTTGNQTYVADVLINGAATLSGATPSFNATAGTVQGAGDNDDLTLNFSGTTTVTGNFTGLQSISSGSGGTTQLSGTITTVGTGSQIYHDDVVLTAATTLTTAGAGDVNLNGNVDGGGFALTVNATTGGVVLGDAAADTFTNLASIDVSGDEGISLSASAVTTTGNQTYQDDVSLLQDTVLTGADLLENSQTIVIDANQKSLTLTFSSDVTLNNVGTVTEIALTDLKTLIVNGGGKTTLNGGGFDLGTVSTSSLTFSDTLVLGNTDVTLKATDITLAAVENAGTARALTLDGGTTAGAGTITLNGAITGVSTLNIGVLQFGGAINLNASVTTTDDQTYYDPVTLGSVVTLTGTGGTADLQMGEVTGNGNALTLSFQDNIYLVGSWTGLFSITADPGGNSKKIFFGRYRNVSNVTGTLSFTTSGSGNFQTWQLDNEKVDPDVNTTLTGGVITYSEQDSNPMATIFVNIVP